MRKLGSAIGLAFFAGALLIPTLGLAQTNTNEVGIFTDPTGSPDSANYHATINTPFNAYLVLTDPVNRTFEDGSNRKVPITAVDGFELAIHLPSFEDGFILLSESYPNPRD